MTPGGGIYLLAVLVICVSPAWLGPLGLLLCLAFLVGHLVYFVWPR